MTRFEKTVFFSLPLFFFFSFPIFLSFPIINDPPKEKTSPQLRGTTRAIVFRALLRRRSGRPTICTNNVANSRSGMGEGRRIARGAEAAEEKICSELWNRVRRASGVRRIRRMCHAATSRGRGVQVTGHRSICERDTHGQKILFDESDENCATCPR